MTTTLPLPLTLTNITSSYLSWKPFKFFRTGNPNFNGYYCFRSSHSYQGRLGKARRLTVYHYLVFPPGICCVVARENLSSLFIASENLQI
ncbi:hypothetical protein L6164_023934 [Bauhinia variegata]|uniref:Uncharacterized protein n=1 Tax=Bauhinia variegata TaxID=167791 RepID=A0ACB9MNJ4_BAUVA|nr:hypothetical protein L6164_023934 [Bauhinia variegata]